MMLIKYSRPFVMCLLLALTAAPITLARQKHPAAYKQCKAACRETLAKAKRDCQSKTGAELAKCEGAAKEASKKCKNGCPK
jgi:hypothetical protein